MKCVVSMAAISNPVFSMKPGKKKKLRAKFTFHQSIAIEVDVIDAVSEAEARGKAMAMIAERYPDADFYQIKAKELAPDMLPEDESVPLVDG